MLTFAPEGQNLCRILKIKTISPIGAKYSAPMELNRMGIAVFYKDPAPMGLINA